MVIEYINLSVNSHGQYRQRIKVNKVSANLYQNLQHLYYLLNFLSMSLIYIYIYVIYMIQCRGCDEQYIGETVNLRNRITLHNQHIRHAELRKIPVSGHIADCSDQDPKYFVFPFYLMKTESIMKRKEKEKYFIRTFLPKLNSLY